MGAQDTTYLFKLSFNMISNPFIPSFVNQLTTNLIQNANSGSRLLFVLASERLGCITIFMISDEMGFRTLGQRLTETSRASIQPQLLAIVQKMG